METLIWLIVAIIEIIFLVCFFKLCKNVKIIMKHLTTIEEDNLENQVRILQAIGNQDKAKEVFAESMKNLCADYLTIYKQDEARAWAIILAQYGETIKKLNYRITIPQEILAAEKKLKEESIAAGKVYEDFYDGQLLYKASSKMVVRAEIKDGRIECLYTNGGHSVFNKSDVIAIDLTAI